ncbi:MAG: hypothetical protein AB7V36_12860, partial [Bacteroidales bacterium]
MHVDVRCSYFYQSTNGGGFEDDVLFFGNDGGLTKIENDIAYNINGNGLCISQFYGVSDSETKAERVLCGAQDNGSFVFDNGSLINTRVGDAYDGVFNSKDSIMLRTCGDGIGNNVNVLKSHTLGQTYKIALTTSEFHLNDAPIVGNAIQSNTVYSCYHDIWKTTDWANNSLSSWSNISNFSTTMPQIANTERIQGFDVFDADENVLWVSFSNPTYSANVYNKLLKSTNGGATWTDITQNISGYPFEYLAITHISIHPTNSSKVYITFGGMSSPSNPTNRVLVTTNGGSSWTDISSGLPFLPVNDLEILEGISGNDILFAATDIGVYWKNGTANWERFGTGLYNCLVDDVEINHLDNVLYAGTYGWGLWKCALPCPDETTSLEISSNTTFSTYTRMGRSILVKNGATFTVTNTMTMPEGSKICIERGGKLVVDGGTIKNGCKSAMWGGIEVWGNSVSSQLTAGAQGKVELKNGAIIENATDAVIAIKKNTDGSIDWNYTGGIISINNATFRNCNNGVSIYTYHNFNPSNPTVTTSNLSVIKNCIFETTDILMDNDGIPYSFLSLIDVEGIGIFGCTFRNTRTDISNASDKGIGILSYDASFMVDDLCISGTSPCYNYQSSIFTNLDYGVKQINTNTNHIASINSAHFADNHHSAYFSGATGTVITRNSFNIARDIGYGIYLDQCNGWQCEENVFTGTTSVNSFGIVVNNSGSVNNIIYNNTFSNLKYGIETLDKNRGILATIGLKIKCNDFSNCSKDIYVTQYSTCSPCGVCQYQGANTSVSAPAGNTFSHTGPSNQYTDFDNVFSGYPIIYYRHAGTTGSWIPYYFRNLTNSITAYTYSKTEACPSNLGGSGGTEKSAIIQGYDYQIDSIYYILNSLVDGGNTAALTQEVSAATNSEALSLRANLLSKSPYVSDTVLAEAATNDIALNPFMLRDVLNSNVHGIKSELVQDAIINRTTPLPLNILNNIMSGLNIVSEYENLQSNVAILSDERKQYINQQIRFWMADSTGGGDEALTMFSQTCNDWDIKAILLFKDSAAMVSGLPNSEAYNSVATLQWKLRNSNRSIFNMTSNEINMLKYYSESMDGYADMYALNMLRISGDTNYNEPIVLTSEERTKIFPVS